MEIRSSLTPNLGIIQDKQTMAERIQKAAEHARSLAERVTSAEGETATISNKLVNKLKDCVVTQLVCRVPSPVCRASKTSCN